MDREYLEPKDLVPPPIHRTSSGNGYIGPIKDGHKLVRSVEGEGPCLDEYIMVIHPEHCYCYGEGISLRTHDTWISGAGHQYQEEHGIVYVDYIGCSWGYVQEGWEFTVRGDDKYGLWVGNLYGAGVKGAYESLEEGLPLDVEVEVTWEMRWSYDPYFMEHDNEFTFWVEKK